MLKYNILQINHIIKILNVLKKSKNCQEIVKFFDNFMTIL